MTYDQWKTLPPWDDYPYLQDEDDGYEFDLMARLEAHAEDIQNDNH